MHEAGGDRYATVVAIAAALDNPVAVLLADRTTYGDALDAGSTAVETNGAVPWTDGPTLPAVTAAFLAAYSTSTVSALSVPAVTADSAAAHAGRSRLLRLGCRGACRELRLCWSGGVRPARRTQMSSFGTR